MNRHYLHSFVCLLTHGSRVIASLAAVFLLTTSLNAQNAPIDVPVSQLGTKYRLLGELGVPLGDVVKVEGIVVEGPFKGFEGGPNVRVQRINGRATQENIQIPVSPYFGNFGEKVYDGSSLPKLENGQTYEFEGYETGGYIGVPGEAYDRAGLAIQTTGFYFRTDWTVYRAKEITKISFAPSDFMDRAALIEGTAVNRDGHACIEHGGWTLKVSPEAWHKEYEGKLAEAYGVVRGTNDPRVFIMENGPRRLVKLEDQVGHQVELRGTAFSLNDHWWFNYRGTDLYVEGMENLPNWSRNLHYTPVTIRGVLKVEMLPAIDQITLKQDRDLKKYYIIRDASWEKAGSLLSPELMPEE